MKTFPLIHCLNCFNVHTIWGRFTVKSILRSLQMSRIIPECKVWVSTRIRKFRIDGLFAENMAESCLTIDQSEELCTRLSWLIESMFWIQNLSYASDSGINSSNNWLRTTNPRVILPKNIAFMRDWLDYSISNKINSVNNYGTIWFDHKTEISNSERQHNIRDIRVVLTKK